MLGFTSVSTECFYAAEPIPLVCDSRAVMEFVENVHVKTCSSHALFLLTPLSVSAAGSIITSFYIALGNKNFHSSLSY